MKISMIIIAFVLSACGSVALNTTSNTQDTGAPEVSHSATITEKPPSGSATTVPRGNGSPVSDPPEEDNSYKTPPFWVDQLNWERPPQSGCPF